MDKSCVRSTTWNSSTEQGVRYTIKPLGWGNWSLLVVDKIRVTTGKSILLEWKIAHPEILAQQGLYFSGQIREDHFSF